MWISVFCWQPGNFEVQRGWGSGRQDGSCPLSYMKDVPLHMVRFTAGGGHRGAHPHRGETSLICGLIIPTAGDSKSLSCWGCQTKRSFLRGNGPYAAPIWGAASLPAGSPSVASTLGVIWTALWTPDLIFWAGAWMVETPWLPGPRSLPAGLSREGQPPGTGGPNQSPVMRWDLRQLRNVTTKFYLDNWAADELAWGLFIAAPIPGCSAMWVGLSFD